MTQPEGEGSYDYTFVTSVARIALYDDLRSAPRVTEIMPASTPDYIEALASTIYNQAKQAGGSIPYTVVREVSENFIHARFTEIIVSILDGGNTIRFADQGPGISDKKKAQLPGFSSAVEPMKGYIRGVGSGLPIVCDYLDFTHGSISIDDNIGQGTVVTISMNGEAMTKIARKWSFPWANTRPKRTNSSPNESTPAPSNPRNPCNNLCSSPCNNRWRRTTRSKGMFPKLFPHMRRYLPNLTCSRSRPRSCNQLLTLTSSLTPSRSPVRTRRPPSIRERRHSSTLCSPKARLA